jgi:hypothetical protein
VRAGLDAAAPREDTTVKTRATIVAGFVAMIAGVAVLPAGAVADSVSIGVNIGAPPPPPPMVFAAPPQLVVIPGSPVYYAPGVSVNFFFHSGRYYTFHDGAWFFATKHNGPWAFIKPTHVPAPVLGVPVAYYKIPPGHATKMGGPHPGGGHGPGKGHKGKGKHD